MSEPVMPQKAPYVQICAPGNYAWCSCGLSGKQPFCDGSHKTTSFRPVIVKLEESKQIAWCGCKKTKNSPYCDGTHKQIV